MADWLTAWGKTVPETSRDHVNSEMGSDGGMGMDAGDLSALDGARGSAFETMWLEMMIEHHSGAVEMATSERTDGSFPDALALARSIETSQSAEIELMRTMLER